MPGAFQADRHRVDSRPRDGLAPTDGRSGPVFLPPRGDIASNVVASQRREIVFETIPRIRRELPSLSARVRFDVSPHWLELVRVAGLVRQPLRDDHLVLGIDGRLGVIGLGESVLCLHDSTVRVGEIALRAVVGRARKILRRTASSRAIRREIGRPLLARCIGLCLGFQGRFRGADLLHAMRLVRHSLRQLVPTPVDAIGRVRPRPGALR
jgi:hypothetical protein